MITFKVDSDPDSMGSGHLSSPFIAISDVIAITLDYRPDGKRDNLCFHESRNRDHVANRNKRGLTRALEGGGQKIPTPPVFRG